MRKFKFRVWDRDCKHMHICGEDSHDSIYFGEDNEAFYYNLQNGCGSGDEEDDTYRLMQFTGLRDKNGKEIYEGDVLSRSGFGTVYACWDERAAWFAYGATDWVADQGRGMPLSSLSLDQWEVIGNVHQSPELLPGGAGR